MAPKKPVTTANPALASPPPQQAGKANGNSKKNESSLATAKQSDSKSPAPAPKASTAVSAGAGAAPATDSAATTAASPVICAGCGQSIRDIKSARSYKMNTHVTHFWHSGGSCTKCVVKGCKFNLPKPTVPITDINEYPLLHTGKLYCRLHYIDAAKPVREHVSSINLLVSVSDRLYQWYGSLCPSGQPHGFGFFEPISDDLAIPVFKPGSKVVTAATASTATGNTNSPPSTGDTKEKDVGVCEAHYGQSIYGLSVGGGSVPNLLSPDVTFTGTVRDRYWVSGTLNDTTTGIEMASGEWSGAPHRSIRWLCSDLINGTVKNYPLDNDGFKMVVSGVFADGSLKTGKVIDRAPDAKWASYDGEWTADKHTSGVRITTKDGSVYDGQWSADGLYQLSGMRKMADGAMFNGMWDGKASDVFLSGLKTLADGTRVEIDRVTGNGTEQRPDGSLYVGRYFNGVKHGIGKFYFDGAAGLAKNEYVEQDWSHGVLRTEHDVGPARNGAQILQKLGAVQSEIKDNAVVSDAKMSFLVESAELEMSSPASLAPVIGAGGGGSSAATDALLTQLVAEVKSLRAQQAQQHAELLASQAKQHSELVAVLRDLASNKK